jgi:hypothetical protein
MKAAGKPALRRRRAPAAVGNVLALDARRIERALEQRTRYKYVKPRVEREGLGWKIVSPNCSRNIDPAGGEIDIAWLVPDNEGHWLLHSRDHARDCWQLRGRGVLPALLDQLAADPQREFWQ